VKAIGIMSFGSFRRLNHLCVAGYGHMNNLFVGPCKMVFGSTKYGKLLNLITQNVIWANQKTEYLVFC